MNTNRIVGSVPRRPSWAGRMMSPLSQPGASTRDPNSLPEQISRLARGFGGMVNSAVEGVKGLSLRSSPGGPSSLSDQISGAARGFGGMVNSAVGGMKGLSLRSAKPQASASPMMPQQGMASAGVPEGLAPFSFGNRLPPAAMQRGMGPLVGPQPLGLSPLEAGQMSTGPSLGANRGFGYPMQGPPGLQGGASYVPLGRSPVTPAEYGPSSGMGVGPLRGFQNSPNIMNQANPSGMIPNQVYPGQGPQMRGQMPSFSGSIPPNIWGMGGLAGREAGLEDMLSLMQGIGRGEGINAQLGRAADSANYAGAYGPRLQSIMGATGISEQERARFAETGSYGFGPSPVQSAASGGAIGAGMAARPFERINNSPVMINPDRGLGHRDFVVGGYGGDPYRTHRQMTDDQSMNKMDREREAATPPGQVMPPPGTANYTRTTADGRRAGTSRRQFALDGLAAAQAAGDKGRVDAFMTEIAKMDAEKARIDANDVQRRQKYRDEHGGLNRRGVENQERENRKALRWMMKNNIKPNSPLLKLKFPGAAERMGMASPLAGGAGGAGGASGSPITAPSGTPRAAQEAEDHMKTGFAATPIAKAMGLGPDATHTDLVSAIDTGPDRNFEDTDLVDIQKALQAQIELAKQNQTYDENDPFGLGGVTGYAEEDAAFLNQHYMGLLSAKTPQERAKWLEAHKNRGSVLEENNKKRGAKGLSPLVPTPPFGFDTAI
jgi:hypothetical protein